MRTYAIRAAVPAYYKTMRELLLRDQSFDSLQPVQKLYLGDVIGLFLKTFVKLYGNEELTTKDRLDMKRLLNKAIEAKDAIDGIYREGDI